MNNLLLCLRDVCFGYPDMERFLFQGVSLSVYSGDRIGLLGYNGAGKTTLLDIIKGIKKPDSGSVDRFSERIFYLKQEDYASGEMCVLDYLLSERSGFLPIYREIKSAENGEITNPIKYGEQIEKFNEMRGFEFLHTIERTITLFGFSLEVLKRKVNTLSGGERRLLKLASGFINESDLFLLDEPTNYLDDRGIKFLTDGINSSKAAFLIVSHNRWFLDQTVKKIIEIEQRTIRKYSGNYTVFFKTKADEINEKLKKKKKIEGEVRHLKEIERSYKIWGKRKEKEKIGAEDKGFISHRAAKLMKRAKSAKERIHKKIEELEKSKPYIEKFYDIRFEKAEIHKGGCLSVNGLSKSFGDKILFNDLSFTIGWGEKVALVGPNGSGKTTLLEILLGIKSQDKGEVNWGKLVNIGYLPQEWNSDEDEIRISDLFFRDMHHKAQILMGCLKVKGDNFYRRLGDLSEGQKRKIKIVRLILSEHNILILDEPTTHLDYITVEKLEKALVKFNGTIILVTHDRFLRERVTTREIKL